jgi:hypothetical protein
METQLILETLAKLNNEMKANQAELNASQEDSVARLEVKMDANQAKMAKQEDMLARM